MKGFKDYLPFLWVTIYIVIVLAVVSLSIYICVIAKNDVYIMVKLPDGAIVEGDGSYRNISEETCKVCIDGIWYKTSYRNVVIMKKK